MARRQIVHEHDLIIADADGAVELARRSDDGRNDNAILAAREEIDTIASGGIDRINPVLGCELIGALSEPFRVRNAPDLQSVQHTAVHRPGQIDEGGSRTGHHIGI